MTRPGTKRAKSRRQALAAANRRCRPLGRNLVIESLEDRHLLATIVVPSDQPTIQAAVNASNAGDTIQINSGTYNESVNISAGAGSLTFVGNNTGGGLPTITGVNSFSNATPETADFTFDSLIISGSGEGIVLTDVMGTVQILNSTFNAGDNDHIDITVNSGVSTVAFISSNMFNDTTSNEQGVELDVFGTGMSNVTIVDNTFNNDQIQIDANYNDNSINTLLISSNTHNGVGSPTPITVFTDEASQATITIDGNTISSPDGKGIGDILGDTSSQVLSITNNIFPSIGSSTDDNAIDIGASSGQSPTLNAVISGNMIGTAGSVAEAGLRVQGNGSTANFSLVIEDNSFLNTNSAGGDAAMEIVAEGATINVAITGNAIGAGVGAATGILLDADTGGAGTINIQDSTPMGNSGPNTDIGEVMDNNTFGNSGPDVVVVETSGSVNYTVGGTPVNLANIPQLLGNLVWNDNGAGGGTAGDGIQNGSEPGLVGVRMDLSGPATGTAFTNAQGIYLFSVVPGNYTLTVTPPVGFALSPQGAGGNSAIDSDFNTGTMQAAATVAQGVNNLDIDAGMLVAPPAETEVTLASGTVTITDVNGGSSNDNLTISYSGGTYTLTDTGGLTIDASSIAGSTGSGTNTVTIPDTGVSGILFNTLGGNDTVTVGSVQPTLSSGFTITGGAGTDTANLNGAINTGAGNIDITAEQTNVAANLSATTGNQVFDGNVDFSGTRSLTAANINFRNGSTTFDSTDDISFTATGKVTSEVSNSLAFVRGSMRLLSGTVLDSLGGATLTDGASNMNFRGSGTFNNEGVFNHAAGGSGDNLELFDTLTFNNNGTFNFQHQGDIRLRATTTFNNAGLIVKSVAGGDPSFIFGFSVDGDNGTFHNLAGGEVRSNAGTLNVSPGGGGANNGNTSDPASIWTANGGNTNLSGFNSWTGTFNGSASGGRFVTIEDDGNGSVADDFEVGAAGATFNISGNGVQWSDDDIDTNGNTLTNLGLLTVVNGETKELKGGGELVTGTGGVTTINSTVTSVGGSALRVASGGLLQGTGTFTGPVLVESGGTLAPGTSPGVFASGNFNLMSGGDLAIEIAGNAGPGAAGGHDQVNVSGTVTLTGNLVLSGGYTPTPTDSFVIINNDLSDAVSGTFNGLPEGQSFSINGAPVSITYQGGASNNDVVIGFNSNPVIIGTPGNDDFFVRRSGGDVEVYQGTDATGTLLLAAPLTSLNSLTIDGTDGDDTVDVSFDTGDPVPTGGIRFNGGANGGGGDTLNITDGAATQIIYTPNDPAGAAGPTAMGNFDIDGSVISFTGLEPALVTTSAATVTIDLSSLVVSETVTLSDGGVAGQSQVAFLNNNLEDAVFTNPTGLLEVIGTGGAAHTINVEGLDAAFSADLTIDADSDDTINFQTNPTDIGAGTLTADALTVNVAAGITAVGAVDIMASQDIAVAAGVTIQADSDMAGNEGLTLTAGRQITMGNGSSAITAGGPNTLSANSAGTTPGNFTGIALNGANVLSDGGAVTLIGKGGNGGGSGVASSGTISNTGGSITIDGDGPLGVGVWLMGGGMVTATGAATIDIIGSTTTLNGSGVFLDGPISSEDGAVTITADSNEANVRVNVNITKVGGANSSLTIRADGDIVFDNSADVSSGGGQFAVTLNSDRNEAGGGGIRLNPGTIIDSNGGDITLGGGANPLTTPAQGTADTSNDGVRLDSSRLIAGAGDISVRGVGPDDGIETIFSAAIQTTTGNITIVGGSSATTDNFRHGVTIAGSTPVSSIDGNIQITGQGGNTSGNGAIGVSLAQSSVVSTSGAGSIVITGTGGNTTAAPGISVASGVSATGSGSVTLNGAGGSGNNDGVSITGTVAANSGALVVNGDGTGSGDGIDLGISGSITSGTGTVDLVSEDDIEFAFFSSVNSISGAVTIIADNAAGNNGGAVNMADLSSINGGDGVVTITADGNVNLASVTTTSVADPSVSVSTTSGGIADSLGSEAANVTGGNVVFRAATGIGTADDIDTAASTLAAINTISGDIQIDNSAGSLLTVSTVDGLPGISNSGGSIRLTADDLNVLQPIAASGDVELFSSNATRTFALGSGPAVKGSGITTGTAAFGLDDGELDLITAGGQRRVIGDGSSDLFNVNYGGSDTQPLFVLGLAGDDEFFVAPSTTMPINLDGGMPTAPALPGDTLHLDMSGALPVVIVDTIGGYAISASTAVVSFVEMETLDLCDDSGEIDNADIGDLYVRTTNDRERITFTSWNDGGVKLRVDNLDAGASTTFPQHFGLNMGQQMLTQLLVYAQDGDDLVSVATHVVDAGLNPIPVEFHGEDGDDYLTGANGDDLLVGGPGNDRVLGGNGNNVLYGDGNELDVDGIPIEEPTDGDDYVSGRDGNDIIFGGGGVDRLYGSGGQDYVHAGSGDDLVDGGLDDDVIIGADGNDNLSGNYGNDILLGGAGVDQLSGRQGDDVLLGGNESDRVRGDAGNDLIVGGNASNVTDATTDAALRAILADWVSNNPAVPAGLGTLQLDGVQDLLMGDAGADAFHQSALPDLLAEDRVYDFRASDGDSLL